MTTSIRHIQRNPGGRPLVQVSLDLITIEDALRMASIAMSAGADWLEIGTPLALAVGTEAVRALRAEYPDVPLIADLKIMDGGDGEARLYADAGADAVVVMGRAHDATVECVVAAAAETGMLVMGDDMGAPDPVTEAVRLQGLGVGMILHHVGHDHRNKHRSLQLSPLTDLRAIVAASTVPVQAVGGLSIDDAVACPAYGASVVVFGAPLAIDDETQFTIPEGDLPRVLSDAIARVHGATVHLPAVVA